MDGFYVAKFKVQKRAKVKVAAQDTEPTNVEDVSEQHEDVGFDSEEDKAYIEGLSIDLHFIFHCSCHFFQRENGDS